MTKSTMQLLENNRKTHKALQQQEKQKQRQPASDTIKMDEDDEDDEQSIKDLLEEILSKDPWQGQRASKMDLDDFLQLLAEFNGAGVHFC